ncbi:hypothetical protein BDK51DRAFT_25916 [Blyttiomyces helicus]|uniref:Plasmid pRiA4b Orf3-like domain-containing protein n=1 Tax=Blyttiomyces helicus TaxID=388810 RepID=A0A4P9WB37_9FUNG|nr:hypothetical protein BDK51DRAFT_25916 [Blyttiomyces helicus]|eukprot:RKO89831.1 hypothetical protein BDK51DRAFT_25916 [Blyttiomyces helicus]
MTYAFGSFVAQLPANVKSGGVELAALKETEEGKGGEYLSNNDIRPFAGSHILISIVLDDGKRATLRGAISERLEIDAAAGIEYAYVFEAKQHKLFEDEAEFPGFWKATVQFSKFRWALKALVAGSEDAFNAAEAKRVSELKEVAEGETSEKAYEEGVVAIKAGKYEEAVAILTRGIYVLNTEMEKLEKTLAAEDEKEVDLEVPEEEEEEEDPEEPLVSARIRILSARVQAYHHLRAYRNAIRDFEIIEQIVGGPTDALNMLLPTEATAYFKALLATAYSQLKLGNVALASEGFTGVMILGVVHDQIVESDKEGDEAFESVPKEIAAELAEEAGKALKESGFNPNTSVVYTLKITLQGVEPAVTRTLEVTNDTTLDDLREFISYSFGWASTKSHEFHINDHGIVKFTSLPDEDDLEDGELTLTQEEEDRLDTCEDEAVVRVDSAVSKVGDSFKFLIESGDWTHDIVLEAIREEVAAECCTGDADEKDGEHEHEHDGPVFPRVVAGARACPPSSIGGPKGYADFLKLVVDRVPAGDKFASRIEALKFAAEESGHTSVALDSWPGNDRKSVEELFSADAVEEEEEAKKAVEEPAKDLEVGGWDADAFDLELVNKFITAVVQMDDEEDWEDEDEEEEADAPEQ